MEVAARVAVSMGDPAGVGPEIVLHLLGNSEEADLVVFGEERYLRSAAASCGSDLPALKIIPPGDPEGALREVKEPLLVEVSSEGNVRAGEPSPRSGEASFRYIDEASSFVLAGTCEALLTMPVSKAAWHQAGHEFPGQTEFLGMKCGALPVMMLAGGGLRIALVTTHLALREVPRALNEELISHVCRATEAALKRDFAFERPRVGVMGLNPHASEEGKFGDEEACVITPALEAARSEGLDIRGPLPPDTAPKMMLDGEFDVLIAMYHEQAALPVKTLAFHTGVNMTLGLPIIRTSPDHGTAFDIAGKGLSRPDSSLAALELAMAAVRRRGSKPE